MKTLFRFVLVCFLTFTTQIGGIVYLLSLVISKKWNKKLKFKTSIIFIGLYFLSTLIIIPLIAPFFGREKVKNSEKIKPTNYMTVLLNRNYVKPKLNDLLSNTAKKLNGSNITIHYLDANFPFINKFPLLPHMSHNDGKKIDISLVYETQNGIITNKQKSVSGYGVFEAPKSNEYDQINKCLKENLLYDFPKYLTFEKINKELVFSEKGTKMLIKNILNSSDVGKIFIEPHLKNRINLKNKKIRFHGCGAVRHDDHIHIELK